MSILDAMRQSLTAGNDGNSNPGVLGFIGSLGNIGGINILRAATGSGQQFALNLQASIITSIQNIVGGDRMAKRIMNIFGSKGAAKLPRLSDAGEAIFLAGGTGQSMGPKS